MNNDVDNLVDDLLMRWHRYSGGYQSARGFGSTSSMFHDAGHTSTRAREEDQEARAEKIIMQRFDEQVRKVPQPWFTALAFEARNLCTGRSVWTSPRLPTNAAELEVIRLEARTKLMRELARDGILS